MDLGPEVVFGFRFAPVFVLASAFGLAGCEDDSPLVAGDATELCELNCGKLFTCGSLVSVAERDACISGCSDPMCEVTAQEVIACESALNTASCDDVQDGKLPEACELCPAGDAGTEDAGMSMSAIQCIELQTCCDALAEPERSACASTVAANDGSTCATARATYCRAPDFGVPDTGAPDFGIPDTGAPDLGPPDLGPPDTGVRDTGVRDTGGGSSCAQLAMCCVNLDLLARAACELVVLGASETECSATLTLLRLEGSCP